MELHAHREEHEHPETHAISIWFFIGVVLVVYGALIMGASIYGLFVPPAHEVVLAKLHVGVWWGALLLLFGIIYTVKFFPKKSQN
jgi:uncharacterized membrane protein HdeD (DUF308 family)